jgi:hypothetical protein
MDGLASIARNDMAYWWPILQKVNVWTPPTTLVPAPDGLDCLLDGQLPSGYARFMVDLYAAADAIGYPIFLRTGQTSGKHDWDRTCYVPDAEALSSHVAALVEYSALAHIMGLPTTTWAVREFMSLQHSFIAFRGMPVAREFRAFVRDGKCECLHFYWPEDSIRDPVTITDRQPVDGWRERLRRMAALDDMDRRNLTAIAERVGRAFPGYWSIDMAEHLIGSWLVTDMAVGDDSFHMPGCKFGQE